MSEMLHMACFLPQFEADFRSLEIDSLSNWYVIAVEETGIDSMVV